MCLDVEKPFYRFLVLFFNCLLTFGSYYCFDMPSVLQDQMQKEFNCNGTANSTANSTCCSDCLGMTPSQYNLLYAVYSWTTYVLPDIEVNEGTGTSCIMFSKGIEQLSLGVGHINVLEGPQRNAFVVIGAGFFIDKFGNQVGALLFSSLCVIGSSIFALGSFYRGTDYLLPLMLLGRLIFGAGNGSLTIVQNRITSFWFSRKELALAFGVTLAFSRLGSVLNFFLTGHLYSVVGLQYTLWIGAGLCGLGFVSAITVGLLDVHGFKRLGMLDRINSESKNVKISDIKQFSSSYWLMILTIMFFYNGVFPFVADASKFIKDKYDYDDTNAAYIAGTVYDVSLVLSPFLGGLIDVFGKRGILTISCAVATIPVFGLLAFSDVHPVVSTLWLGVTYSVAAASMWPSIPLVVAQATIGTAMGIATSVQMIGIGFSNLIVGEILGHEDNLPKDTILLHWKYMMIYLLCNTLACVATATALNIVDSRKNGVLNMSRKEARQKIEEENNINSDVADTKALVNALENSHDSNEAFA